MAKYTKSQILEIAEEEDVEFIRLQFTDMSGTMKNMAITAGQLEHALDNKCTFDGSASKVLPVWKSLICIFIGSGHVCDPSVAPPAG